jgi:hypothetical protein
MNQIYLFAIASILATASLMAGTFTVAAFAQGSTTPPGGDMGSTIDMGSSNMTGGNMTSGTGMDNSTIGPA